MPKSSSVSPLKLARVSTEPPRGTSRESIKAATDLLEDELAELDDLLYSASQHSMLVVLQGRDTAGKDGAIRKVLDACNAQGVRVEPFKVPTDEERAHDFLWRVHAKAPALGQIVLFNRSHYEDVLVARVHELVPRAAIESRYGAINDFERLLTANRTIVVKFFLHISFDEQEKRLRDREKEREKAWKLSVGDWNEREYWDEYTHAYELALARCSSPEAPWHVVPSDAKWYRNYVVLKALVEAIRPHRAAWLDSLSAIGKARLAEIRKYRASKKR